MTTFKQYLGKAWTTQHEDAQKIADEFKLNFNLMETEDDVMAMATLVTHICGEKLGAWEKGLDLLKKLKNNAPIKDKEQMKKLVAILTLGNNPNTSIEEFSPVDQVNIYSTTAVALINLGGVKNAEKLLDKAIAVTKDEPSQKFLSEAAAKIVKVLEKKEERRPNEEELLKKSKELV